MDYVTRNVIAAEFYRLIRESHNTELWESFTGFTGDALDSLFALSQDELEKPMNVCGDSTATEVNFGNLGAALRPEKRCCSFSCIPLETVARERSDYSRAVIYMVFQWVL